VAREAAVRGCEGALMREKEHTCKTCTFWGPPHSQVRECRRHAPIDYKLSAGIKHAVWPETDPYNWCGDFNWKREDDD